MLCGAPQEVMIGITSNKNDNPNIQCQRRFDPVYSDARARAASLGEFNFYSAWMSQPKAQLETFRAWAGKDSDIR